MGHLKYLNFNFFNCRKKKTKEKEGEIREKFMKGSRVFIHKIQNYLMIIDCCQDVSLQAGSFNLERSIDRFYGVCELGWGKNIFTNL